MANAKKYLIKIKCPICKKERLVGRHGVARAKKLKTWTGYCNKCRAIERGNSIPQELHPSWKGGRFKMSDGYIHIVIRKDDPFVKMADRPHRRVPEHRYVMAKYLGRCLDRFELVHHINGIRYDNRIENLKLTCPREHNMLHGMTGGTWVYNLNLNKREWRTI